MSKSKAFILEPTEARQLAEKLSGILADDPEAAIVLPETEDGNSIDITNVDRLARR